MADNKFCPSCGNKLEENATFCSGCGAKVNPNNQNVLNSYEAQDTSKKRKRKQDRDCCLSDCCDDGCCCHCNCDICDFADCDCCSCL